MYDLTAYILYLTISIAITIWVARTLFKNGRVFLVEAFRGNSALADSVNKLLVVGFYLVNVGFITMTLKSNVLPRNSREVIEFLSSEIGTVLLFLGAMHFFNLFIFSRMRKKGAVKNAPPPLVPEAKKIATA